MFRVMVMRRTAGTDAQWKRKLWITGDDTLGSVDLTVKSIHILDELRAISAQIDMESSTGGLAHA